MLASPADFSVTTVRKHYARERTDTNSIHKYKERAEASPGIVHRVLAYLARISRAPYLSDFSLCSVSRRPPPTPLLRQDPWSKLPCLPCAATHQDGAASTPLIPTSPHIRLRPLQQHAASTFAPHSSTNPHVTPGVSTNYRVTTSAQLTSTKSSTAQLNQVQHFTTQPSPSPLSVRVDDQCTAPRVHK